MRLLTWNSHNELTFIKVSKRDDVPPYAILSHTWGADNDEVNLADLEHGRARDKLGYKKIQFCCERAQRDEIKHFWIDTCCIDKSDSVELSEAINSMYRWYRDAKKCYVYLSDVSADQAGDRGGKPFTREVESSLQTSRWFTRGWTLQELLAPKVVEFFSHDRAFLGTKETLAEQICGITGIPLAALYGAPPTQFSIAERWRWSWGRQTSKTEDRAYCLLGIFDVFLPLIYGEGDNAFLRLEKEVSGRSEVSTYPRPGETGTKRSFSLYSLSGTTVYASGNDEYADQDLKRLKREGAEAHDVQRDTEAFKKRQRKYNSLLKSLQFGRIDFRVNNVQKALLSTCEWLLCHPDFQAWHENSLGDQHNGFMWIKGKPGCGKSTLMKAAVEWARKANPQNHVDQIVIPYFFNARASSSLEKSSLGLYRTVVYRLLSTFESLQSLFMNKFGLKKPGPGGEYWTREELQEFLIDSVESWESFRLCLFIDALDEAELESDIRQMISFLIQLSDRASAAGNSCQLQICLSSRHYPHVTIGRGLSLVVEEQVEHGHDIETYIDKQLTCPDGPDKDVLRNSILQKSAGIFLWVVLVVDMLNHLDDCGAPLSDMQARLEMVPTGLNELFQDTLLKSSHGIETTVVFLQWSLFGMRPIEPAELYVAIEHSRRPADSAWVLPSQVSVPSPDRLARYILNSSHGLVEVVARGNGQRPVVQFVHETVREFLMKGNGLVSIDPALATNLAGISHEILRIACQRCISAHAHPDSYQDFCRTRKQKSETYDEFVSNLRSKSPFLEYAIRYMFQHAEQAQKHGLSQQSFFATQTNEQGELLESYRTRWNALQQFEFKKIRPSATLFHFVAAENYPQLVQQLLEAGAEVDQPGWKGLTPLYTASSLGHVRVVERLLKAGANFDAKGEHGQPAIYEASRRGHEKVVEVLLEAGADVNTMYPDAMHCVNALQVASAYNHEEVVQVLLEAGVDVNAQGGMYGYALCTASEAGHEKVVQTLIEAGANVDLQESQYGDALYVASTNGREKVVQVLLEAGANVNKQRGHYGSPLYTASKRNHERVVRMLLDAGAEVNAQGGHYGRALHAASRIGNKEVVQMLLRAGADVNAEEGLFGYALQAASAYLHRETVQILLEAGANVNAQGGCYGTALQAASIRQCEDIVQMLKDAGAS